MLPKPGDDNERPLTMLEELRNIEGMLAMSRQYRAAMIVQKAAKYILEMEAKLNELEGKDDGLDAGTQQEPVSEATGPETSLD